MTEAGARAAEARVAGGDDGSAGDVLPFELPAELEIDTRVARRIITGFIREQLRQAGFERVVLGLSGGIDSALVAYLVADAVGADRLLCVLMPYRSSSRASVDDAREVVRALGCPSTLVEITPIVDGYFEGSAAAGLAGWGDAPASAADASAEGITARDASALRRGNFMARARMCVLYDLSVPWGGLVAGTGNKTESLIGYTTVYGDSACAFNPIGDLYKTQVRQLAREMGVPDAIVRKAPSADLWPGQTDESDVGFSYAEVDGLLYQLVDRRRTPEEAVEAGFERALVERVVQMVAAAEFKRQVPPIAKLSARSTGIDYLYPRRRPGSARRGAG